MSSQRVQISLLERLDLLQKFIRLVFPALTTAIVAPFRRSNYKTPPEYSKNVCYTALRTFLNSASIRQLQYVSKYQKHRSWSAKQATADLVYGYIAEPTDELYQDFARAKGFQPETTVLPYGAKAHWLGKKSATNVVICFHGGGYVLPPGPQIDLHWDIQNKILKNTSVVILSYSLAPGAQYPTQLQQAVELVRYLIRDAGKKPSNIFLSGDSAGGNLAVAVLSHLLHPHPSILPLELAEPLGGALLLSPWVEFATTAPSFERNRYSDSVGASAAARWSASFMGNAAPDNYTHPTRAPQAWWDRLRHVVEEIFIVGGADEIFVDDIRTFSNNIEAAHPACVTLIVEGESHAQPVVDISIGWKIDGVQAQATKAWFAKTIR